MLSSLPPKYPETVESNNYLPDQIVQSFKADERCTLVQLDKAAMWSGSYTKLSTRQWVQMDLQADPAFPLLRFKELLEKCVWCAVSVIGRNDSSSILKGLTDVTRPLRRSLTFLLGQGSPASSVIPKEINSPIVWASESKSGVST